MMNKVEMVSKLEAKGIKFFPLTIENDYEEAQSILDSGQVTEELSAEDCFTERVEEVKQFLGTYEIKVERTSYYEEFIDMLEEERDHVRKEYYDKFNALEQEYRYSYITYSEYLDRHTKLINELDEKRKNCNCSLCSFRLPTFEEWKTGKYQLDEKRQVKLGKQMRKAGFSQQLLDYYSAQIKTEKKVYLTISDRVQHIAGMSYYAKKGSWNGYGGTSCQDPRHNNDESLCLGGSLHDDKLIIGMLHNSLDDLQDMTDKLRARVLFRLVHVKDVPIIVATTYYGNVETKDMLHYALKQLEEAGTGIFSNDIRRNGTWIREKANGYYDMVIVDEVHVWETRDRYVTVDCPLCHGTGNYYVYSYRIGDDVRIDCPACSGSGEIETEVYIDIDEYVEVEGNTEIQPYAEGYSHYGDYIEIYINVEKVKEIMGIK